MNQETTAGRLKARPAFQRTSRSWWRGLAGSQEFGVLIILCAMILYLYLKTNTFTSPQNVSNVILAFSWIAIAAFGQTLVIITGGIDLSTGAVMALSGLAAAFFISGDKSPWAVKQVTSTGREIMVVDGKYLPLALLAGCAMGLFVGAINGVLVAWGGLPAFIATLGMMSVARGFCYGWAEGWPFRQLNAAFRGIGQNELPLPLVSYDIPYPTLVMVALVIIMSIFLLRTIWGYRIYALGGNEQAAQLSGINTRHVTLLAFSLSGLMAGIGGTLMTARLGVAMPTAANGYELDVIAAVFIGGASVKGGKGTMIGTLIGAAIMQVLRNGLNLVGASAYWQPAAIGFVILVAIMLDRARQNPQVQAYFRQFEGRVAVISVLVMTLVNFAAAVIFGLGADAMIVLLLTLPFYSLLYFLHYKSLISPAVTPWRRWFATILFVFLLGIAGAIVLAGIWYLVRRGMMRLSNASERAQFEVRMAVVSIVVLTIVSFIGALFYGLKVEALYVLISAWLVYFLLYFFYYRGVVNPPAASWGRWVAIVLFVVTATVVDTATAFYLDVVSPPSASWGHWIAIVLFVVLSGVAFAVIISGLWYFLRKAAEGTPKPSESDELVPQDANL
jgi:ribose transport system permease protein